MVRLESTFGTDFWEDETDGDRAEGPADFCHIFLAQHGQNYGRAFGSEFGLPCVGENPRTGRVMGAVDHDPVVPALKPGWPLDLDEAPGNRLLADIDFSSSQGRQGEGGVTLLVFPKQGYLRSAAIDANE